MEEYVLNERTGQPHEELNEVKKMNLPDKEFKVIIINKLIKLRRMNEHGKNFNKELENIKKNEEHNLGIQ